MAVLATETWTGTNGAAWPSLWTGAAGTHTIQGNAGQQVTASGATADRFHSTMSSTTVFDVYVTMTPGSVVGWAGIGVGAQWGDFYLAGSYMLQMVLSSSTNNVTIITTPAGSNAPTTRATASVAFSTSTAYKLRFTRAGGVISAKIWTGATEPGTATLSWTDTVSQAAGRFQVSAYGNTGVQTVTWDDLTVYDAAPTGTTLAGVVATAAAAAPAGTFSADTVLAGPVATAAGAAPAGSFSAGATLAGPVATAAAAAPAGSVIGGINLAGPTVNADASAPAGGLVLWQIPHGETDAQLIGDVGLARAVLVESAPDAVLTFDGSSYATLAAVGTTDLIVDPIVNYRPDAWSYGPGVSASGGQLTLPYTVSYSGGVWSYAPFDARTATATVRMASAAAGADNEAIVALQDLTTPDTRLVMWDANSGDVAAWYRDNSTTSTWLGAIPYVPGIWLRLAIAGGTASWQSSADGTSWTTNFTWAMPWALTSARAALFVGCWGTPPAPAVYDHFSLVGPQVGAGTGDASLATA